MWQSIGLLYLLSGIFIILFTRAQRVIRESISDVNGMTTPIWKVVTLWVLVYAAAVLLWPVFIPSWFSKQETAWDALKDNSLFQEQKALFETMSLMTEDGVDADELPNGRGEFGMTASNPIPCNSIFGSTAYLGRLRTSSGTEIVYERLGSTTSDVSEHPVDIYEVANSTGEKMATLYLSPYQKRNSRKAPSGFKLLNVET